MNSEKSIEGGRVERIKIIVAEKTEQYLVDSK